MINFFRNFPKIKILLGALLGFAYIPLFSQSEWQRFDRTMPKLGTLVKITFYTPPAVNGDEIMVHCFQIIDSLNHILSDYDANSELSGLNQLAKGDTVLISNILLDVLCKSRSVYNHSQGAFDPAIGQLTGLWRTARKNGKIPGRNMIRKAKNRSGMHLIYLNANTNQFAKNHHLVSLDLGGIGKGYIGDQILAYLGTLKIESALVNLGGDIVVGDPPPGSDSWTVQIEGFSTPVSLSNQAIAGSGKTFQHLTIDQSSFSHIINRDSGYGVSHDYKVYVIAQTGWEADAWASAYSVMGYLPDLPFSEKYPQMWIGSDSLFYSNHFIDYLSPSIKKP